MSHTEAPTKQSAPAAGEKDAEVTRGTAETGDDNGSAAQEKSRTKESALERLCADLTWNG